MMAVLLWLVFLGVLAYLWAREILVFEAMRRTEEGTRPSDFQRFRRRTLGLVLLLILAALVHLGAVTPNLDHQGRIGWAGICFILVIWLLIVAARDFRASLEELMDEQQRAAIEAIIEVERAAAMHREGQPLEDHMMIPRLDFRAGDSRKAAE